MNSFRFWVALLAAAGLCVSISGSAVAEQTGQQAPDNLASSRMGSSGVHGRIQSVSHLPGAKIRLAFQQLRSSARDRALKALNKSSLSFSDVAQLNIDRGGALFFVDRFPVKTSAQAGSGDNQNADTALLSIKTKADLFALHSKPGSTHILILDFDGHDIEQTGWNGGKSAIFRATPFSQDNDFSSFSPAERTAIQRIWQRVAEDFAPFDIDVTTEEPGMVGPTVGRVLITRNRDLDDRPMPFADASGLAYLGVWGSADYAAYSPALVYYNQLAGQVNYIAEAASHQVGHNLGLGHQGRTGEDYYPGHGEGPTAWAPIMGNSLHSNVTQWSWGDYPNASSGQDGVAVIAEQLSLREDDHSGDASAATELSVADDGAVVASPIGMDSGNSTRTNQGVIETADDVDSFAFTSLGGAVKLMVTPAWDRFDGGISRGANLDIGLTLLGGSGKVVTRDPAEHTHAVITEVLPAGRYTLQVTGVGSGASPYSDYASLGHYFISGKISTPIDDTPPSPNPMGWLKPPRATGKASIAMTALTASDSSGVEYQFSCSVAGPGCRTGNWQASPDYVATGLDSATAYSFQVTARNGRGKVTQPGPAMSATTASNLPPVARADDAGTLFTGDSLRIEVLNNDRDPDGELLTIVGVAQPVHGKVEVNGNALIYRAGAQQGSDHFEYTIADADGATANALVSITVPAPNRPPVAVDDFVAVSEAHSTRIDVVGNDSDPDRGQLTLVSVGGASHGVVTIEDGTALYRSDKHYYGLDQFSYVIEDAGGATANGQVSITVNSTNQSPVAVDDFVTAGVDGIQIEMLSNDRDPDDDPITVIWLSLAENGTVALEGSSITYVPNQGFLGSDSFDYQIEDPEGATAIATVTVAVAVAGSE